MLDKEEEASPQVPIGMSTSTRTYLTGVEDVFCATPFI